MTAFVIDFFALFLVPTLPYTTLAGWLWLASGFVLSSTVGRDERISRGGGSRFISGRPIPVDKQRGMLLTFQDRIRIPWRGGAKQITVDNVLPVVLLVALQLLAAVDFYCSLVIFTAIPVLLAYLKRFLGRVLPK